MSSSAGSSTSERIRRAHGNKRNKFSRSNYDADPSDDTSSSSSSFSRSRSRKATDSGASSGSASASRSDLECYSSRHNHGSSSQYRRRHSRSGSESSLRHQNERSSRDHQRQARERPQASRCIGVFGLNTHTTQHKVRELFSKFGPIERIQMVIDAHTHRSRGFCFIYFENLSDARVAKDSCSGMEVDERRIRVDYSFTQRAHTPTPGIYMGRPSRFSRRSRERYGYPNADELPRLPFRRHERGSSSSCEYERHYRRSERERDRDREHRRQKRSSSRQHYERSRSRSVRSPARSRTPRKVRDRRY